MRNNHLPPMFYDYTPADEQTVNPADAETDDYTFLRQLRSRAQAHDAMPPTRRGGYTNADANAVTRRITRNSYKRERFAAKTRMPQQAAKRFDGTLRPGARLALEGPLLCGGQVLEAGSEAVVDAVFPKLRIRGERQTRPATVEFDDAARVMRRIPTVDLSCSDLLDPESIAFDVTVLDE